MYQPYYGIDGKFIGVIRENDNAIIPIDLKNRDWNEFLDWDAENNLDKSDKVLPPPTPDKQLTDEFGNKIIAAIIEAIYLGNNAPLWAKNTIKNAHDFISSVRGG